METTSTGKWSSNNSQEEAKPYNYGIVCVIHFYPNAVIGAGKGKQILAVRKSIKKFRYGASGRKWVFRLGRLHDSLPHEAFSTCSHHLPPNLADLDFYHNFYHKINHNCGLGVQGKLSGRTWHYPRVATIPGLPLFLESHLGRKAQTCGKRFMWQAIVDLLKFQNPISTKLGGASPKVSIPYRKFF